MNKFKILVAVICFLFVAGGMMFAEEQLLEKSEDYQPKIPVKVLERVPLPSGYHEDLYFDGKNFWITNGENEPTWIIDPEDGSIVSEIKPIGTFSEGIISAGDDKFWVTDWDDKKMHLVDVVDNKMESLKEVSFSPARPTGIELVDDNFYIITWTRGMGTKYHLLKLDSKGNVLSNYLIESIHGPAHMTWDGKNLWITSWYSKLIYKVNINTFLIEGSFKSPISDATGITWDGKYLWITGTRSDLYKIEISE